MILDTTQKSKIKTAFQSGRLRVRSMSPSGVETWKQVLEVHRADVGPESIVEVTTTRGASILTSGHRIFTSPVSKIEAGEVVSPTTVVGTEILSVRLLPSRQYMYDLTAEGWHNFYLHKSGLLVSNSPDRNYHFRPPAHEETIGQFNKVFGHIWEGEELQEYLFRSLDMISASPPRTPFASVDQLVQTYPEWRTLLLNGAMMHALLALMINWIADEFSVAPDTEVTVGLHDGRRISLTIAELFDVVQSEGQTRADIREAFRNGTLMVQAVQDTGQVGWFPISDVLRHKVPHKVTVKVTLDDGRSVTATEDHSLFIGLTPVSAGDISVGSPLTTVFEDSLSSCSVQSVEVIPNEIGVMYDLSVPGPQNFVLTNGILAHNSYSIGGVSLDIEKSSKYESAYQAMNDQFDKQLERAKQTVKILRGLQQPRYGIGIRSAFGPYTSAGTLTPRKFLGLVFPFLLSLQWVLDMIGTTSYT